MRSRSHVDNCFLPCGIRMSWRNAPVEQPHQAARIRIACNDHRAELGAFHQGFVGGHLEPALYRAFAARQMARPALEFEQRQDVLGELTCGFSGGAAQASPGRNSTAGPTKTNIDNAVAAPIAKVYRVVMRTSLTRRSPSGGRSRREPAPAGRCKGKRKCGRGPASLRRDAFAAKSRNAWQNDARPAERSAERDALPRRGRPTFRSVSARCGGYGQGLRRPCLDRSAGIRRSRRRRGGSARCPWRSGIARRRSRAPPTIPSST